MHLDISYNPIIDISNVSKDLKFLNLNGTSVNDRAALDISMNTNVEEEIRFLLMVYTRSFS